MDLTSNSLDFFGPNQLLYHILPILLLGGLLFGLIALFFKWIESKCPSCGEPWRQQIDKIKQGESYDFKSEVQQTGRVDGNGQPISVSVKVPYLKTEYLYSWVCRKCKHKWSTTGFETRRG